ncbi:MAG: hypothetical protein A2857_02460 [Candidatus Levybacteria bacterium RIFCSPHIGHO2_01_FULL_36_15]|nr:MAG: hypothetical protein A2857_02460 [Candidatus Levybacteria bacterium RIFCSPHIGHO2_01_FULL_36_15]
MVISVSIGIMAYNEEKNIGKFLNTLLAQTFQKAIYEIIIISSGSTDDTNKIVECFSKRDKRIKLIIEKERKGKSSAVNLFLSLAKRNVVILVSADLLLEKHTLENLLKPFKDTDVGIAGCRPIPINDSKKFMGFTSHFLWSLHHYISLENPKMGEMIAFRKVFKKIPVLSAVDEANIEPLIRGQGYKAVYVPDAIIYNKGPETIKEFIKSRRRIYFGHLATKSEYSYEVSTFNSIKILSFILKNFQYSWRFFVWTPAIILLEAYSRLLGMLDYKFKLKDHVIWETVFTTKQLN